MFIHLQQAQDKRPYRRLFSTLLYSAAIFSLSPLAKADQCSANTTFNVGAGVYDITGPAAEEGMMGYGMLRQQTAGIYQRLWARAFVIESPCNGKRVVFVNADLGQVFQGVKQQVVKKLQEKFGKQYDDKNVLLTATHTHSGPGGYSTYKFYNITTWGFDRTHFDTLVEGIVAAIERAQNNLTPARIRMASGELKGISHNRSPQSYLLNPEKERARYDGDTDTQMTLLRFDSLDGKPIGMINWFPLHGVSMNNKNHLINGDNKGYAEYLFEKDFNSDYGPHSFVAAFAQANAGDVSPNLYGHEGGEGLEGLKAAENAGKPQYEKAKTLYETASQAVNGGVDFRHEFAAMDNVTVQGQYTDGTIQHTCPAAIGVSMLAGTQDGEGLGKQGLSCDNVTSTIPYLVCEMTTTVCQGAKPIAVTTGTKRPPWTPNILPLQLFQIGNMSIIAAPVELTTMTGRHIREAVTAELPQNAHVVISALSNAYAGYVATNAEYDLQRYEGASTHFGPWEQAALSQEFAKLAHAMVNGLPVADGPMPPDLLDSKINLQPGVLFDDKPPMVQFGTVHQDVNRVYRAGDTVQVVFWGGHPKNNYHTQDTFLEVQHFENGAWKTIRRDNDWDTEYHWARSGVSYSLITIVWRTPTDLPKGQYRIIHHGDWKSGWSRKIYPYVGYSSGFTVG